MAVKMAGISADSVRRLTSSSSERRTKLRLKSKSQKHPTSGGRERATLWLPDSIGQPKEDLGFEGLNKRGGANLFSGPASNLLPWSRIKRNCWTFQDSKQVFFH